MSGTITKKDWFEIWKEFKSIKLVIMVLFSFKKDSTFLDVYNKWEKGENYDKSTGNK